MRIKFFPFFLILLFFIIFFIFYKGLQNSNIYTPNIKLEVDVPYFEIKIFDTDKMINSDKIFETDKFYIVNIWASWCIPCKEEHPFLMSLSEYKNLEMVGLNYKDNSAGAKNFLKEFDNPYKTILADTDGTVAIEWGAYGVPETFLIYKKKIIKRIIGPLNKDSTLEIKRLLK
tara:strand:+ start:178 stop:696 length:519 start_codon:yes stop_codon:yes gene_type:complete